MIIMLGENALKVIPGKYLKKYISTTVFKNYY